MESILFNKGDLNHPPLKLRLTGKGGYSALFIVQKIPQQATDIAHGIANDKNHDQQAKHQAKRKRHDLVHWLDHVEREDPINDKLRPTQGD